MIVTIPPHHEEFVRQRIAAGRNRDALSVVAEAIYLHDARRQLRPFMDLRPFMAEVRERLTAVGIAEWSDSGAVEVYEAVLAEHVAAQANEDVPLPTPPVDATG